MTYLQLFTKVSEGIAACATEGDCFECPYKSQRRAVMESKKDLACELQLATDKVKLIRIITFLDKMNEEVDE